MKTTTLLFALLALTPLSHAQILLESRTFASSDVAGMAVQGHLEFWKDSATSKTGTFKLFVDNLSDYRKANSSLTGFEDGILTGIGFNVASGFTYRSNSFTEASTGAVAGWETGSEPGGLGFTPQGAFTVSSETFQEGAFSSSLSGGLSGGYSAVFTFGFSTSSSSNLSSYFNSTAFFGDSDLKDLYFRFESLSSGGCDTDLTDKMFVGFPTGKIPATPEPSTYGLIGAAALGGLVLRRRFRSQA